MVRTHTHAHTHTHENNRNTPRKRRRIPCLFHLFGKVFALNSRINPTCQSRILNPFPRLLGDFEQQLVKLLSADRNVRGAGAPESAALKVLHP